MNMQIKLHRRNGEWSFRGLPIVKKKWCLPFSCTSYLLQTHEGKTLADADTLRELRDDIAGLVEDGKITMATAFEGVKIARAQQEEKVP